MMPIATPPNALATEGGDVSTSDMATAGLALNLVLAVVATAVGVLLVPAILT
jgi:di/tricarboxylate transporter